LKHVFKNVIYANSMVLLYCVPNNAPDEIIHMYSITKNYFIPGNFRWLSRLFIFGVLF